MGFGRGALLWLLGIPLPIIILLALFMHHGLLPRGGFGAAEAALDFFFTAE